MIRSDHLMSRDLGSCIFQEGGFCLQRFRLSASPEIVAAREDFFNHGWTRINTDEDRLSLIRVHPCSSVVGTYWMRLAALRLNPCYLCHPRSTPVPIGRGCSPHP